ncbi:MAG: SagB/ThcOx family dehydrogenase [bacterium]|nr:SagB/ThcOx family dehydrogenase [bacterium]MDT8365401.1 SagB/ThcOx family dehydrogenase [bacterium]
MKNDLIKQHREFLKDTLRKEYDFRQTDQHQGVPAPPVQKPFDPAARRVSLPAPADWKGDIPGTDLESAILNRESRRHYLPDDLSLAELSFLLYCTQGVRQTPHPSVALRTVPSAGARHSFETYLLIRNVEGVDPGLYLYLPMEHALVFLGKVDNMEIRVTLACLGQQFVGAGAVTFVWTTIPYRMEWRYGPLAHRVILIDVGHVCQNLYLACEAIGAGTCGVAAYDQQEVDELIGVDGEEEFTVYLAPVGKVR